MSDIKAKSAKEMTPSEWLASIREKYNLSGNFSFPNNWLEDLLSRMPASDRVGLRDVH